jgi:hypothetical protein
VRSKTNPSLQRIFSISPHEGGCMTEQLITAVDRRRFLTQVVPACSLACLCAGTVGADDASEKIASDNDGKHKFEVEFDQKTTMLQQVTRQNANLIDFIKTLQSEIEEEELIRLLKVNSAEIGRRVGERQAQSSPDTSFQTFVATFRPPRYDKALTLEITEDTATVFQLRVTECVWAKVYRDAGLGGAIGHAAVCNMDYYWPPAFNPNFKMERTATLMAGDDDCNHRYMDMS